MNHEYYEETDEIYAPLPKKKKIAPKMCIMNSKWIKYFLGLCIFSTVIFKHESKGAKAWKKVNWSY